MKVNSSFYIPTRRSVEKTTIPNAVYQKQWNRFIEIDRAHICYMIISQIFFYSAAWLSTVWIRCGLWSLSTVPLIPSRKCGIINENQKKNKINRFLALRKIIHRKFEFKNVCYHSNSSVSNGESTTCLLRLVNI